MPRFVLLEHDYPVVHFDLMFEAGDVLRTWRLLEFPAVGVTIAAEPSFDHRLIYLDYEGAVSGDRGTVVRRAAGNYVMLRESASEWIASLSGDHLNGSARLWQELDGRWWFQIGRFLDTTT
jgi:hypothetical protein